MAKFTLDDIIDAANRKYASTEIEVGETTVELVNPLQLQRAQREELSKLQDLMAEDGADQAELLKSALRTIARNDAQADVLLAKLGDNLAYLAGTFQAYGSETELGEASASAA